MPDPALDVAEARRSLRASACPSLFRFAPARDGGICRLKAPFGRLSAAQARAVAAAAQRCGSGVIDVTNRANLQLRGIAPAREDMLIDALLAAGLGPDHPDADDLRNVMTSPLAGLDPAQHIDAVAVGRALLARVATADAGRTLSPKLGFLVDGGETVAAIDRAHDVWLSSRDTETMALGIAGAPPTRTDDAMPFLIVETDHAIDAVAAAVALFADAAARDPAIVRVKDLVTRHGRDRFLEALAARVGARRGDDWRRSAPVPYGHVGVRAQRQPDRVALGAVPRLGRLSAARLTALAAIAERHGSGALRLTPWQSVMVPDVARAHSAAALAALTDAGLVCDAQDPLASMIACSGSTGCHAGLADAKADALALAALLPRGRAPMTVHVSGCEKRCAARRATDVTVIAAQPGRYRVDGTGDPLDVAAIAARLARAS